MLTELNLHKFDSLIDKCRRSDFQRRIHACGNGIVQHFVYLHLMWLILCYIVVLLYCCIQTGVLLLLFTFLTFNFLLFSMSLLVYGIIAEIGLKMDWLIG